MNKKSIKIGAFILISIYVACIITLLIAYHPWNSITMLGTFGDFFGVINCLFSGLALIIVAYTMIMQREDLELQREEIKKNREELKEQAETQKRQLEQAQKLNDLNLLTTFYGILGKENDHHNEIIQKVNSRFYDREPTSKELNLLTISKKRRDENTDKAYVISEIFNEQFTSITNRLKPLSE